MGGKIDKYHDDNSKKPLLNRISHDTPYENTIINASNTTCNLFNNF